MPEVRACLNTVGMKPTGKEKNTEDAKREASEEGEGDRMQNTERRFILRQEKKRTSGSSPGQE